MWSYININIMLSNIFLGSFSIDVVRIKSKKLTMKKIEKLENDDFYYQV